MSNVTFTIGEVATLLDITSKTIRHYHQIDLLPEPKRDGSNYRVYGMTEITALKKILRLKQFGLSLKQIKIIIDSDNPDELTRVVLNRHADSMRDRLARLQHQLEETTAFLSTNNTISDEHQVEPAVSSLTIFSDTIKQHNTGIADIIVEVERDVMPQLDQFTWDEHYEPFWHYSGKLLVDMITDESLFIFWMERYISLSTMDADDLQGQLWIQ
ncbi:MAG: MerR family transcriptional regulator [Chloroflexota bacterium]